MATQESLRIVKTPEVLGGDPRIEGRRISVLFVHEKVEGLGLSPRTFAERYDLDIADVYRALTYYHEHPEEMVRVKERRQLQIEEASEQANVVTGPNDIDAAHRD